MRIEVDTHIHSIASSHAYSTIQEITAAAHSKGLKIVALTDHGPALPGAPHIWYFLNLRELPEYINKVRLLKGIEANICDSNGTLDIEDGYLKNLEFVLASMHDSCILPGTKEQNTEALVNALSNKYVDAVAHPGNPLYTVDIEAVVKAAAKYNKLIEINNNSFKIRTGSYNNCREFVEQCKKYGVRMLCGSDSHFSQTVGVFDKVIELLEEMKVPEKLIISTSAQTFEKYLEERIKRVNSQ